MEHLFRFFREFPTNFFYFYCIIFLDRVSIQKISSSDISDIPLHSLLSPAKNCFKQAKKRLSDFLFCFLYLSPAAINKKLIHS